MSKKAMARMATVLLVLVAFAVGDLCGSVTQRRADAQGLGGMMDRLGKGSGALGTAGRLGSSIVEMQDHVSGLQKNLDTLKQIQSALTGK